MHCIWSNTINFHLAGGWGSGPLGAGVLIGETVPSDTHGETSHTSESPLFDPSEKTKCCGPWKGMALWNIWRSRECGGFCAWRGEGGREAGGGRAFLSAWVSLKSQADMVE